MDLKEISYISTLRSEASILERIALDQRGFLRTVEFGEEGDATSVLLNVRDAFRREADRMQEHIDDEEEEKSQ